MNWLVSETLETWESGGWLMLPLMLLTVFIYYTALELFFRLNHHFIIRGKVHQRSDEELSQAKHSLLKKTSRLIMQDADSTEDVKRHFHEIRQAWIPLINRRIRFLAVLIPAGPLLGLLGTVTGMLATFNGMAGGTTGTRFDAVAQGISAALITTQSGLIISIPALIILSLILQRRNTLVHGIARLERFNTKLALRQQGSLGA